MKKEIAKLSLELAQKTLELTKLNSALIVYLIEQKKKKARKDVESKRAVKELKKQPAAMF